MVDNSKKLFKTSLIYSGGQILIQGVNFLLLSLYTNKLGTVEYGKISTIVAFSGFISSFLILSIQSGLCRFFKEEEDKSNIINTALNFAYLFSLSLFIIILIVGIPLSHIVFGFGDSFKILYITTITTIFTQIISIYISKYGMEYKALLVSTISLFQVILQLLIIIYLVLIKNIGLMGALYGQLGGSTATLIFLTIKEKKNYKLIINKVLLKKMLVFSIGLLPVNLAGWILTLSDRCFIKYFNGFGETGIYSLGYQFGMLINPIFITPFLNSFTAYKFEIYKDAKAKEKLRDLFRKYTIIGCFIMLGIGIYSRFGIKIFNNKELDSAYKIVPLIIYSYFLYGKTGYYALGFQIENKTYKIGLYMMLAAIINIFLNFFLVPLGGMIGAAASTLISYFILNVVLLKTSNKYYKIHLDLLFQSKIQIITIVLYLLYYFISLSNIKISLEFLLNIFIILAYFSLLILTKSIKVSELNKMLSLPQFKFIRKVIRKSFRILLDLVHRFIDLRKETNFRKEKYISYSYININELDISNIDREALEFLCNKYLEHSFDLLGSGFVKVSYDMKCLGVEGNIYDGSLHISNFDEEGRWLEKVLSKNNLKFSKEIWRSIETKYIPIDWQMDFKSGFRYSQKKWYKDQPIGKKIGVDIKVPWELGRLQHLPELSIAAIAFQDKRELIIKEFKNQILDFIMTNPPKMGVLWRCTMDVGIRTANMLIAYDIFNQLDKYNILDETFNKKLGSFIYESGSFIMNNLEWSEDYVGNHYLSDICGELFISAYLNRDEKIDSCLAFCVQEIIEEAHKQFYEDGSNFEASTSYHRLSGELLVYSTALIYGILKTNKRKVLVQYKRNIKRLRSLSKQQYNIFSKDFFPRGYIERIYRGALFSKDITKENGDVSQIGDNDSGRFFKFSPNGNILSSIDAKNKYINLSSFEFGNDKYFDENILNQDTYISAVNGFYGDIYLSSRDKFKLEKSLIKSLSKNKRLKGRGYISGALRSNEKIENLEYSNYFEIKYGDYSKDKIDFSKFRLISYPYFGIYIYKCKGFYLSVMAGEIGQNGKGGHGHNDKLSFELNIGGIDVFKDRGTYLYTPLRDKRNEFRSSNYHNVPRIQGKEQCEFNGLFSMRNDTTCNVLRFTKENLVISLSYRGTNIIREFKIGENSLQIIDKCNKKINESLNKKNKGDRYYSNGYGKLMRGD